MNPKLRPLNLSAKPSKYTEVYRDFAHLPIVFSFYLSDIFKTNKWSIVKINKNITASDIFLFFDKVEQKSLAQLISDKEFLRYSIANKNNNNCFQLLIEKLREQKIDVENMHRLNFDDKSRIWGVFENSIFYVLFWDENHVFYPVGNYIAMIKHQCVAETCTII